MMTVVATIIINNEFVVVVASSILRSCRSISEMYTFVLSWGRTKWKRQTAVGLELLAEAGNYSALQRMFPSPYFYPQSLVSNLDPGAALYLYRGPSAAPPPALQRPLVPRILLHGLQGGSEPPPPLTSLSGVLPRPTQPR